MIKILSRYDDSVLKEVDAADLRGANLHGADLYGAKNLSDLIAAQLNILPQGDLIGYKKGGRATTHNHGPVTNYIVGKIVRPDKWDTDRWNECSHGIHFFITEEEAKAYE